MKWKRIAIHHTVTPGRSMATWDSIRRYHTASLPAGRGWSDIGYHFGIVEATRADYVAVMGRPFYRRGSHVGGHNTGTLGVALLGDYTREAPPIEQIECCAELCAALCVSMKISTRKIFRHDHFKPTACPGRVDIEHIRELAEKLKRGLGNRAYALRPEPSSAILT